MPYIIGDAIILTTAFKKYQICRDRKTGPEVSYLIEDIGGDFCAQFCACYRLAPFFSLSISSLPQFLRYQSVGTATGPTALCGIRTTPRSEILSPEIQPSEL